MISILMPAAIIALLAAGRARAKRPAPAPTDPLDTRLFGWSDKDPHTRRAQLRSVSIMGAAGSGKTSGSGHSLGLALVNDRKIGGLIIASKPEDRADWQRKFEVAGRTDDLVIFGPDTDHAFDFIGFEKGDTRDITECIMTVSETLNRTGGAKDDAFWGEQHRRMIYNGVEVLRRAYGRVNTAELQSFINGAATNAAMIGGEDWRQGFHNVSLGKALGNISSARQQHDIDLAVKEYWLNEYPFMAEQTRSSILAGVLGKLHVFNTGEVREKISGRTTVTPEIFDEAKWLLVDYPVSSYGAAGAIISGALKYATQRHILRRAATAETPITMIWIDEFQNHINSHDAKYLAECRSHYGGMVVLTQSIHSFNSSMGGEKAQSHTKALLTNFGTKIFHALGDAESAEYAASLIGRTLMHTATSNINQRGQMFEEIMTRSPIASGWSQHMELMLQGRAFMTNLRTGGPENGFMVDGWVIRSGTAFSNGLNHMLVGFSQR